MLKKLTFNHKVVLSKIGKLVKHAKNIDFKSVNRLIMVNKISVMI